MGLDIRMPIGLMFSLVGVLLVGYGLFSPQEIYEAHSLGINVNLGWLHARQSLPDPTMSEPLRLVTAPLPAPQLHEVMSDPPGWGPLARVCQPCRG